MIHCPACGLPVPRGKRWHRLCRPTTRERRRQAGLCVRCGKPAWRAGAEHCEEHLAETARRQLRAKRVRALLEWGEPEPGATVPFPDVLGRLPQGGRRCICGAPATHLTDGAWHCQKH